MTLTEKVLMDACAEFMADFLDAYHRDNDQVVYRTRDTPNPNGEQESFFTQDPIPTGEPMVLQQNYLTDDNDDPRMNDGRADDDGGDVHGNTTTTGPETLTPTPTPPPPSIGSYAQRFGADGAGRSRRLCLLSEDTRTAIRERFNRYRSASAPFYDAIYQRRHQSQNHHDEGENETNPSAGQRTPFQHLVPHAAPEEDEEEETNDEEDDVLFMNTAAACDNAAAHQTPDLQHQQQDQHHQDDQACRPAWVLPIGYYDASIDRFVYAVRCPAHFIVDFAIRVVLLPHLLDQIPPSSSSTSTVLDAGLGSGTGRSRSTVHGGASFTLWVNALKQHLSKLYTDHHRRAQDSTNPNNNADRLSSWALITQSNTNSAHRIKNANHECTSTATASNNTISVESVLGNLPLDYTPEAFQRGLNWCEAVLWPDTGTDAPTSTATRTATRIRQWSVDHTFHHVLIGKCSYVIWADYEWRSNARGDGSQQSGLANTVAFGKRAIYRTMLHPEHVFWLDRGPQFSFRKELNGCGQRFYRWHAEESPAFVRWLMHLSRSSPLPRSVPALLWSALVVAFGAASRFSGVLARMVGMHYSIAAKANSAKFRSQARTMVDLHALAGNTEVVLCGDMTMSFSDLHLSPIGTSMAAHGSTTMAGTTVAAAAATATPHLALNPNTSRRRHHRPPNTPPRFHHRHEHHADYITNRSRSNSDNALDDPSLTLDEDAMLADLFGSSAGGGWTARGTAATATPPTARTNPQGSTGALNPNNREPKTPAPAPPQAQAQALSYPLEQRACSRSRSRSRPRRQHTPPIPAAESTQEEDPLPNTINRDDYYDVDDDGTDNAADDGRDDASLVDEGSSPLSGVSSGDFHSNNNTGSDTTSDSSSDSSSSDSTSDDDEIVMIKTNRERDAGPATAASVADALIRPRRDPFEEGEGDGARRRGRSAARSDSDPAMPVALDDVNATTHQKRSRGRSASFGFECEESARTLLHRGRGRRTEDDGGGSKVSSAATANRAVSDRTSETPHQYDARSQRPPQMDGGDHRSPAIGLAAEATSPRSASSNNNNNHGSGEGADGGGAREAAVLAPVGTSTANNTVATSSSRTGPAAASSPAARPPTAAAAPLCESVSYAIAGVYPVGPTASPFSSPTRGSSTTTDQQQFQQPQSQRPFPLRVSLSSPPMHFTDADIVVASSVSTRVPVALTWWLAYGSQRVVLNLDQMVVDGLVTTYQISATSFILTFRPGTLAVGWDYAVCLEASAASGASTSAEATFSVSMPPVEGGGGPDGGPALVIGPVRGMSVVNPPVPHVRSERRDIRLSALGMKK